MTGSIIASEIDRDYKLEKYYKKHKKRKCKGNCSQCNYASFCIDKEETEDEKMDKANSRSLY